MKRHLLLSFLIILTACSKDSGLADTPLSILKYTLTVTASPSNGGLVNPTTGSYNAGERVTILASANQYYVFNNWTGNWNSSENQITITMDSNKTIIANFTKVDDDEDGVLNINDICPGTPLGSNVDTSGCGGSQLDSDGDGVTDDIDQCENTPANTLLVSATGCKVDLFYFAENGVTIKAHELAEVGMQEEFNGNVYTVVSESELYDKALNEEDMSYLVTTKVTNMNSLFGKGLSGWNTQLERDVPSINGEITHWDVSNVTDMSWMFSGATFNQPIGDWDVSNVTSMFGMLRKTNFNQPIGNWDVSNVTNMQWMFGGDLGSDFFSSFSTLSERIGKGSPFNQPIGDWDVSNVTNMAGMFNYSAFNQNISGWDVSNVTNMASMFSGSSFNQPIGNWDVSNVTNMGSMFEIAVFNQPIGNWDVSSLEGISFLFAWNKFFNQDISSWDVSNMKYMSSAFYESIFNQDISGWDVSNVTNMRYMFSRSSFNQPIGDWDVSNVTNMQNMFELSLFNQDINGWDVSNVTHMNWMFSLSSFNQPIGNWDVSNVTDMMGMFYYAKEFNQPIGDWDVSNVTNMDRIFSHSKFNQPIGDWDVSNVTTMSKMFNSNVNLTVSDPYDGSVNIFFLAASPFNQDISGWDVSNVTNMESMYKFSLFNHDISGWDVNSVTDMSYMFEESSFNQPIGSWDVSNVSNMYKMFFQANSFNQDLSSWDVSNVEYCTKFSDGTDGWTLPKPNFTNCNAGTSISNPDSSNGSTENTESTDTSSTSGSSGTTETTESTDTSSSSNTEITYSIPSNFQLSSTHLAAETFYSILLQWDYNNDQNINSINIYRGDSASQLSLHKNITNSSSSQYQDTEVDIRKDYYYQISYVYSNQEYSRTEILNTQAYEPVNSNNPPSNEVGGVHYANQYFSVDRFDSIKHKFTIHSEPSNNTPLYYQFYQGQINDNIGFYYGIQTLMSSTNNPNPRGKALIFSRWETNDSSNLSLADGGWSEVAGYEGDFISVRNAYEWTSGTYEIELKKDSTDVVGDWYSLKIKSFPNGNEVHAGSIRFESSSSASGIKSGGILWTEIYGNGSYPDWHVSVDDITINDNQKPNYIGTAYSSKFKDFSNIYTTNNCDIHFLMGPNVKNITPAYTFDWCE